MLSLHASSLHLDSTVNRAYHTYSTLGSGGCCVLLVSFNIINENISFCLKCTRPIVDSCKSRGEKSVSMHSIPLGSTLYAVTAKHSPTYHISQLQIETKHCLGVHLKSYYCIDYDFTVEDAYRRLHVVYLCAATKRKSCILVASADIGTVGGVAFDGES